jgi:NAD(P)-dependent dehydrogenase (short-subunit alcohol dehydrogenase family)
MADKMKKAPQQRQKKQPGVEYKMHPQPEYIRKNYKGSSRLQDKIALITGGDSGIGRAVAVHFATEGAHVAIVYKNEDEDALYTKTLVEQLGRECLLIAGDLKKTSVRKKIISLTLKKFKKLDILVNNAAVQFEQESLIDITDEQIKETFETNIFSIISLTREALNHLKKGGRIINTTSVTAYRGSEHLMDYSATKGAITTFTRSLAKNLVKKGILVNAVAPGPIWTPLIPSSFKKVSDFGKKTPMGRPGQPSEVAPAYVFLASDDATYITGEVIHINGGDFVGG